ncbi:ribonuclease Z [Thalassospira sp. MA62]|nr:ribonuclease Z [Thalassospira sp. MA62]
MEITLLGTGAAHDPVLTNASGLVRVGGLCLLIDCGFSAVRPLQHAVPNPDGIDGVLMTHHHPDHVFGLVPLIDHWSDIGRRKPLLIATTQAGIDQIKALIILAFGPKWQPKFQIDWHLVPDQLVLPVAAPTGLTGDQDRGRQDIVIGFAKTDHTSPNHALRIDFEGKSFAYSGDGAPTKAAMALYHGVDFLMQECFVADPERLSPGHCDLPSCVALKQACQIKRMGLYHIHPDEKSAVANGVAGQAAITVPAQGSIIHL